MEDWRPLDETDAANGLPPWQVMTPTAEISPRPIPHKEMDQADINQVINDFRTATKLSIDAGYDIAEIHGAHGYLIHQFCRLHQISAKTHMVVRLKIGCDLRLRLQVQFATYGPSNILFFSAFRG